MVEFQKIMGEMAWGHRLAQVSSPWLGLELGISPKFLDETIQMNMFDSATNLYELSKN